MHVLLVGFLKPTSGLLISIAWRVMVSRMEVSGLMDFIVTEIGPAPFSEQSMSAPDSFTSKNMGSLNVSPPGLVNSTTLRGSALAVGVLANKIIA